MRLEEKIFWRSRFTFIPRGGGSIDFLWYFFDIHGLSTGTETSMMAKSFSDIIFYRQPTKFLKSKEY